MLLKNQQLANKGSGVLVKAVKVLGNGSSAEWSQENAETFEKRVNNRVNISEEIKVYF